MLSIRDEAGPFRNKNLSRSGRDALAPPSSANSQISPPNRVETAFLTMLAMLLVVLVMLCCFPWMVHPVDPCSTKGLDAKECIC